MSPLDDAATEFFRWYGPWAPLDPAGVATLLAGFNRPWWLVGGWSIHAFTGVARDHEDVDVSVLACDMSALRGHLGNAWTPWSNSAGTLRPLNDRFPDPLNVEGQIWLRRDATSPWEVDLPITPDRDGLWTNKRWPEHVAPVEEVTWVGDDGIRYLNPEITLLYKAALDRDKDRHDLSATWPLLSTEKRSWLRAALDALYPGHAWFQLIWREGGKQPKRSNDWPGWSPLSATTYLAVAASLAKAAPQAQAVLRRIP